MPTTLDLPVVDMTAFLKDSTSAEGKKVAELVAKSFKETGVCVLRDPRATFDNNSAFLDMMENYFDQDDETKSADVRPELHYQVGMTPAFQEEPLCVQDEVCKKRIADLTEDNKPAPLTGPDAKGRFFWRIGERPTETEFKELNAPQVIPAAFQDTWETKMDLWGNTLLSAVTSVAEAAAVGLGMEKTTFSDKMKLAPHLLAPTATDLNKYANPETVYAGFHSDLNFITIHGKSRYPGLYIWLRDGTKCTVAIPEGCLLAQAGMQFEYLSGGVIHAGFHEVVCTPATMAAVEKTTADGTRPLWRISSTLFSQIASDVTLEPLPIFIDQMAEGDKERFPAVKTGDFVASILSQINLTSASDRVDPTTQ